jgi:hypothetical protein
METGGSLLSSQEFTIGPNLRQFKPSHKAQTPPPIQDPL